MARPSATPRGPRLRTVAALSAALTIIALAGCHQQGSDRGTAAGVGRGQPSTSGSPSAKVAVPRLAVIGIQAGMLGAGAPVRLAVSGGQLKGPVKVTPSLPGAITGRTGWASKSETKPATTYRFTATALDSAGAPHPVSASLRTASTDGTLQARLTPGDGAMVGIGMPVAATFNHSVAKGDRAAVEKRLQVRTTHPLTGAWYWLSSKEAHFRPVQYWPAHEPVQVRAEMPGLYLKSGLWGGPTRTSAFRIGAAHVSVADVRAHRFTVYSGGHKLRSYPASMGSSRYPSKGGVHIALEMARSVTMDSSTIGIPRGSPGSYFETVLWDVRISYGGAFVHAAPWSVGSQGRVNVSHGCVNLATSAARWFYGFTQRGDIVNVTHARIGPDAYDPGTADWNLSWAQWLAGSAAGARVTTV
jgi:lipoprotein-anchoring transpeptidase ErfK/SrfK